MNVYKALLYLYSVLILITVFLPFIRKDLWVFRIFDYPRVQKFFLIGIAATIWLVYYSNSDLWYDQILMITLGLSFVYIGYLIVPFTFLGKRMIQRAEVNERETLDVLVANVYQYNDKFDKLLKLIAKRDPDIVFLLETDSRWQEGVKVLHQKYPHSIEVANDNTYGLLFYSKLPMTSHQINYLIDDEIPSIIANVTFDNQSVRIYGLHPTPPVPQENAHSTDRDAEILIVGQMAKEYKGPCMVIGDLNDVAWSYTTKLFLKSSELLDPRRGRGMYSTFHAKYRLLRWPLDHFFVSSHFHLVDMKVENAIGSDHFPISICLVITQAKDAEKLERSEEDDQLVDDKINAGLTGNPL